ncbi:hypothetical protein C8Q77DRAFT_1158464 [Trametes polyzona]|nr:hypothetical protein C8Q77DRAFT_1158464 [Trametes polyzona]
MSSHTVVIDDSDADAIHYVNTGSGLGWSPYTGTSLDEDTEGPIHNSTLHVATAAVTSVELAFQGTRVAVYGSVWPPTTTYVPLTVSRYTIFTADPLANISMGLFQAPNFTVPKNGLNLFTSDEMAYGSYVLTVNVTRTSIDSPYYLDYIAIEAPGPTPPTTTTSAMMSQILSSGSPDSAETSIYPSAQSGASPPPIGAIIGAAIGGASLVCIVAFVFLYTRRRRRPPVYDYDYVGEPDSPAPVTPYVMPELEEAMREAALAPVSGATPALDVPRYSRDMVADRSFHDGSSIEGDDAPPAYSPR